MTRTTKIFLVTLIAAAAVLAAGCPERRTIAELNANPGKYNGKDVTIAGRVKNSYGGSIPVINIGAGVYEIDDGTGTMWVVAQGGVPSKGAEIAVSGMFGNVITWGGRNYGTGIQEKERHYRKR